VRYYDGTTGLKTGFTQNAGYCLAATAMRDGVEYISVTLGDATSQDRFESAKALLSYGFSHYTLAYPQTDVIYPIKVELGTQEYVQPVAENNEPFLIQRDQSNSITFEVQLPQSVKAPLITGDNVGKIIIKAGETVIGERNLIASQDSKRLSYFSIFGRMLSILFGTR